MSYKAVIFDFDYTLGDCTQGIAISINYALEHMNLPAANMECIRHAIGMTLQDTYTFLTKDASVEKREEFTSLFKERADTIMTECAEFLPFAKELLTALYEADIKVGIVTTKLTKRIVSIFEKFGCLELIQYVRGIDSVAVPKPDPEGLLSMVKEMNLSLDEVLYVGDNIVDAKAAASAGIDFAAVTTGTTAKDEFATYPNVIIMQDLRPVYMLTRI